MNVTFKKLDKVISKFQQGGEIPTGEAPAEGGVPAEQAPAQEGGQDPMMLLVQVFQQGLQSQDCLLLAQGAQMFLQMVSQASGETESPAEPVFRKGGTLLRRVRN